MTKEEKELLTNSIDDIIKDTPETVSSATKVKKMLTTIGKEAIKDISKILVDIASETAKKILFPS